MTTGARDGGGGIWAAIPFPQGGVCRIHLLSDGSFHTTHDRERYHPTPGVMGDEKEDGRIQGDAKEGCEAEVEPERLQYKVRVFRVESSETHEQKMPPP